MSEQTPSDQNVSEGDDQRRYGDALGSRLRGYGNDLPATDLVSSTTSRGIQIRRRRRVGLIAVAALVVAAIPISAMTVTNLQRPLPPPVASPTPNPPAPTANEPAPSESPAELPNPDQIEPVPDETAPTSVDLDLASLDRGPDAAVDYVADRVWHQPDGGEFSIKTRTPPRDDYQGKFFASQGKLLAWVHAPHRGGWQSMSSYTEAGERELIEADGKEFFRGPDGSILWTATESRADTDTLRQLTLDGTIQELGTFEPSGDGDRHAASAGALWFQRGTDVGFAPMNPDLGRYTALPGFTWLFAADPVADTVTLGDAEGCSTVLDASTLVPRWKSCQWEPLAFSPDGRYAVAASTATGGLGAILDAATGLPLVELKNFSGTVASMVFDDQGNLNLQGFGDGDEIDYEAAVVTCTVAGECWRSSDTYTGSTNSGQTLIGIAEQSGG